MKRIKRPIGRPVIIVDRVTITRSVPRTAVVIIDQLIKELKETQTIKQHENISSIHGTKER